MNADTYQAVHDRYSAIARNSASADEAANAKIATKVGYTAAELQTTSGANLGLSCGAPIAQAKLQQVKNRAKDWILNGFFAIILLITKNIW